MPTKFQKKVWGIAKKIPRGKVITYKQIAKTLRGRAYRAVGNALNKNPHAPKVPCHRVVNSDGSLGGYAKGLRRKTELLRREGVEINKNKINLNRYLWKG